MTYKNAVRLLGKIMKITFAQSGTSARIVLKTQKSRDHASLPTIYFNGSDVKERLRDIDAGDYVEIEGRYQTVPSEGPKTVQAIVGHKIWKALSEEEKAGAAGGKIYVCRNQIALEGHLKSFEPRGKDYYLATLDVKSDRDASDNITVSIFQPSSKEAELRKIFKEDAPVFVMGEIQTKPPRDGFRKQQFIVARSFQRIDHNTSESIIKEVNSRC